jgi:hypothetical protein
MTRRCEGLNACDEPCGAAPLKPGTIIADVNVTGRWCRQHDQDLPDSARIGGAQPGAGRPRQQRPSEVAQRLIEDNVAVVLGPHFRALGFDVVQAEEGLALTPIAEGGAKLHGTSKDGLVRASEHDDIGAQIAASEKLQDRIYGRPKQSQEISGPEGGPVRTLPMEPPDPDGTRSAKVAEIIARSVLGDNARTLSPAELVEGMRRRADAGQD